MHSSMSLIGKIKKNIDLEKKLIGYDGSDKVISSHELKKILEEKDQNLENFSSGFIQYDKYCKGFETGELIVLSGYTGMGKCLGKGTPVLMFNGEIKKVENIKTGDLLMGDDSKPRKVLTLARGKEQMFKITPKKGPAYLVNKSHILSLIETGRTLQKKIKGEQVNIGIIPKGKKIDISVSDYLQINKGRKHILKGYRTKIFFATQNISLDPYFLGLWLGDGTSSKPEITTADKIISKYLFSYAKKLKLKVSVYSQKENKSKKYNIVRKKEFSPVNKRNKKGYGKIKSLLSLLKELDLINNKHIPDIYKVNSRKIRLELLAGLIDSDGSLWQKNLEFSNSNRLLIQDFLFLCRSLGFGAYMKSRTIQYRKKNFNSYRIHISGNVSEIPVRLKRKKSFKRLQKKDPLVYGIKVRPEGMGNYYGFTLDKNGRFLLGDFTVTHNTSLAQTFTANFAKDKNYTLWFSYEMPPRQFLRKFNVLPLFYVPKEIKGSAISWIEEKIIEAKVKYGIKVVMIDHLHFLVDMIKMNSPSLEIGTIVRSLKTLCIKHNIVIFLIAHTTKPKGNKMPGLEDFRDSSFITQEADCAMAIQRAKLLGGSYGPDSWLIILKHRREGVMGRKIKLTYQDNQFQEISFEEEEERAVEQENFYDPFK